MILPKTSQLGDSNQAKKTPECLLAQRRSVEIDAFTATAEVTRKMAA